MDRLLLAIENILTTAYNRLSLVYTSDGFLYRDDVQEVMAQKNGLHFVSGDSLSLRIHFETIYKRSNDRYCYLLRYNQTLLEDISTEANIVDFRMKDLFVEYNIEPLLIAELWKLSELYSNKPIITQSKFQTLAILNAMQQETSIDAPKYIQVDKFETIDKVKDAALNVAEILLYELAHNSVSKPTLDYIEDVNMQFQDFLRKQFYSNIVPSSPVVSPKVVSKILPYISSNYQIDDKIAVIVIDGMSYWQYLCLFKQLASQEELDINNDFIFSWIPSITTLSRQAIFRGDRPNFDYKQSPANESKLWFNFWEGKGVPHSNIAYNYDSIDNLHNGITKFAYVTGELDEKMHASSDYTDLYALTNMWVKKGIVADICKLLSMNFSVFITTDHGNIQTQAWRSLNQSEKTGTRDLGSRSQRHLEYSESWLKDQFLANNSDIASHLFIKGNCMAISNDWNFSSKGSVSHGGSHILEVVVPFIKIKKTK